MTPRELAIKLITPYVLRGDEPKHIYDGYMGMSGDEGSVQCGGYVRGKHFHKTKVIVSRLGPWDTGKEVCEVFDFYELYKRGSEAAASTANAILTLRDAGAAGLAKILKIFNITLRGLKLLNTHATIQQKASQEVLQFHPRVIATVN